MEIRNADVRGKITLVPAKKGQPHDMAERPAKPETGEVRGDDNTSLLTSRLKEMVTAAPIVNENRVSELANAVKTQSYRIDSQNVAKKLLRQEMSLR